MIIPQSPEVTQSLCLQSGNSISNEFYSNCFNCCNNYANDKRLEEKANAPMPWIGLYVAAASLICSLAMAADLFLGFRHKKLWFPCKFFSLNAAYLTLLAVAMKLTMDLNTRMPRTSDQQAKLISIAFMCTIMGNFMPSLGKMNDKEIFTNLVALGILVVTIIVNICIQMSTNVIEFLFKFSDSILMFMMLILFVLMCSSTLYIHSTRKYIDLRYREIHKTSSSDQGIISKFDVDKLKKSVRSYWMMAQTGSPQFVMARSVTCVASGAICIMIALLLFLVLFNTTRIFNNPAPLSSYKESILVIVMIQTTGVVVGSIACAFRVFTTVKLKCSRLRGKSFKTEFKIEDYWIERLVKWKKKELPLKIRNQKSKRLVHSMKNLCMCFCIGIQIVIVVVSKSIQLLFVLIFAPFLLCYHHCKQLKRKLKPNSSCSSDHSSSKSTIVTKMDLNHCVLHLEGENELSERMLKNISKAVDRLIQMGKKQEPKNLKELLEKSTGFEGVTEFDNDQVPSLVSYEPPNSWMMVVVTLTTIAIALPNIANQMVVELLSSVSEGLYYISLVEKELHEKRDLINIKNAAEVMWLEVELFRKWLDQDLRKMASKEKNYKGTLESLAEIARNIIVEFNEKANEIQKENPLEWPEEAIAANSMYRISNTLLLDFDLGNEQSDEMLFKKLSVMISDILVACLTNLPRVITMKCFCITTEKREKGVQQAAHLLGETEEILKILQQRELPSLNQDQAACIDEWRAIIKRERSFYPVSSSNDPSCSGSVEIHIAGEHEAG